MERIRYSKKDETLIKSEQSEKDLLNGKTIIISFSLFFCLFRKGEKIMRATKQSESTMKLTVTTDGLQNLLDCGRPTAVEIVIFV